MTARRHSGWNPGALTREAVKNVLAVRGRLYPILLLAAAAGALAPMFAAAESANLTRQLDTEALAGRNLVTLQSIDPARPAAISRASCDALTQLPGVRRAGIITRIGAGDFPQLGTDISILAVSPTLLPQLTQATAVVGSTLHSDSRAFRLATNPTSSVRAAAGERQPDRLGLNDAVAVAPDTSITSSTSCFVILDQLADEQALEPEILAAVQSEGGPLTVDYQFSGPVNPVTAFLGQPGRSLGIALGAFGALVLIIVDRSRGSEWAAYRLSGTSSRALVGLVALESAVLGGVYVLASASTIAIVASTLFAPAADVGKALAGGALWAALTIMGTVDLAFRAPISLARDR